MLNSAQKGPPQKIKKRNSGFGIAAATRPGLRRPVSTHGTAPAVVAINFQRRRKPRAFRVRGKRLDAKVTAKVLEEQYLELELAVRFTAELFH